MICNKGHVSNVLILAIVIAGLSVNYNLLQYSHNLLKGLCAISLELRSHLKSSKGGKRFQ